jgi:hypothetical protein
VIQTAAEPPNHGRIILVIMGWTWKSRNALRTMVRADRNMRSGDYLISLGRAKKECIWYATEGKIESARQGRPGAVSDVDRS